MDLRNRCTTEVDSDKLGSLAADRHRLAEQIADGHLPFPKNLDANETCRLAEMVRDNRRTRLVKFLARQIAIDIARSHSGIEADEGKSHAEDKL